MKYVRTNERISTPTVRVIDADGKQLGIKNTKEAITLARQQGLDLVEIAPNVNPPVCKIIEFSKFRYLQDKKLKESRKKQKFGVLKEIKIRPKIGLHDLDVKIRHIQRFLSEKDKVKVNIFFAGREFSHVELGEGIINRIKESISQIGVVEQQPRLFGHTMSMILAPKK